MFSINDQNHYKQGMRLFIQINHQKKLIHIWQKELLIKEKN